MLFEGRDKRLRHLRDRPQLGREQHIIERDVWLERSDGKSPIGIIGGGNGIEYGAAETLQHQRTDRHRILRLDNQVALDPCILEDAIDPMTSPVFKRERDEALAPQIGRRNAVLAGEPVARWQDTCTVAFDERRHRDPRQFPCRRSQADVELLVGHPLPDCRRTARLQLNGNTRVAGSERGDNRRQKTDGQRRQGRNTKGSGRSVTDIFGSALQHGNPGKTPLNLMEKDVGFRRHRERNALGSDEQFETDLMFQVGQQFADCGLGNMERGRSLRHRPRQHHGTERLKLSKIHFWPRWSCASVIAYPNMKMKSYNHVS